MYRNYLLCFYYQDFPTRSGNTSQILNYYFSPRGCDNEFDCLHRLAVKVKPKDWYMFLFILFQAGYWTRVYLINWNLVYVYTNILNSILWWKLKEILLSLWILSRYIFPFKWQGALYFSKTKFGVCTLQCITIMCQKNSSLQ